MTETSIRLTGQESHFDDDEIIVTKTDLSGRITYANDVFLRVSHFSRRDVIGQPHNIIRHPHMPRCIFKLLWETLEAKQEMFAYVVNRASNGDHYWVFAHVTPSFDESGSVVGYHSSRRKPDPDQITKIIPLYKMLLEEEQRPRNRKDGMNKAYEELFAVLRNNGVLYDQFVLAV